MQMLISVWAATIVGGRDRHTATSDCNELAEAYQARETRPVMTACRNTVYLYRLVTLCYL